MTPRPGSLTSLGNSFNLKLTSGSANVSSNIVTPKSSRGKKFELFVYYFNSQNLFVFLII